MQLRSSPAVQYQWPPSLPLHPYHHLPLVQPPDPAPVPASWEALGRCSTQSDGSDRGLGNAGEAGTAIAPSTPFLALG